MKAAIAAETVAKDNGFHPIKDYLESLVWDGVERIAIFAAWAIVVRRRLEFGARPMRRSGSTAAYPDHGYASRNG